MKSGGSIEIQGFLIQGTHDALIELRNAHGTRHGNHLALHAAEVLLIKYPMLLSDLQHSVSPESRGAESGMLVKIAFKRSAYPLLAACHASLRWGGQGVGMINLLNRLYMIAEAAPELVEELMQQKRLESVTQNAVGVGQGIVLNNQATSTNVADLSGEHESHHEPEITEIVLRDVEVPQPVIGNNDLLTSPDDPLNGLNFGNMF